MSRKSLMSTPQMMLQYAAQVSKCLYYFRSLQRYLHNITGATDGDSDIEEVNVVLSMNEIIARIRSLRGQGPVLLPADPFSNPPQTNPTSAMLLNSNSASGLLPDLESHNVPGNKLSPFNICYTII
jgi:hypothetical protein